MSLTIYTSRDFPKKKLKSMYDESKPGLITKQLEDLVRPQIKSLLTEVQKKEEDADNRIIQIWTNLEVSGLKGIRAVSEFPLTTEGRQKLRKDYSYSTHDGNSWEMCCRINFLYSFKVCRHWNYKRYMPEEAYSRIQHKITTCQSLTIEEIKAEFAAQQTLLIENFVSYSSTIILAKEPAVLEIPVFW